MTQDEEEHARAIAANPPGIRYEIRFADGRSRFTQGEVIRVELAFSSSLARIYQLDGGRYDRSGRLRLDAYVLDPDDAEDPLADLFEDGHDGYGGMRQMPVLDATPYVMTFELNEWKRFDRAGRYRLHVRSARLRREAAGGAEHLEATSNALDLVIEPVSPGEARRALEEAILLLRSDGDEERCRGARALRFLGSEGAALEMVRRLAGDPFHEHRHEYRFGLIGSRHRAAIVRAMEERLAEAAPITKDFLETLALLRDKLERRGPTVRERRLAIVDAYAARLCAVLASKPEASRAVCAATVLEVAWQRDGDPPAYASSALAMVPRVLRELPVALGARLLDSYWLRIRTPGMGAVLRDLYDDPRAPEGMRRLALRRLVELDPPGARQRIVAQLRAGVPDLGVLGRYTLSLLPDATLPELDAPLAERLERSVDLETIAMIARYATRAAFERVRAVHAGRAARRGADFQDADVEGSFLGYFLRVEPAHGATAARALYAANPRHVGRALQGAAALAMTVDLEDVLIAALDAPATETVCAAASALAKHGSAAAEPALWSRIERLHAEWKDRPDVLRHSFVDPDQDGGARQVEMALAHAIETGAAWPCERDGYRRLHELVVSAHMKEETGHGARATAGRSTLMLRRMDSGEINIRAAQYKLASFAALEAKLAQLAPGTAFMWTAWGEESGDFARVQRTLAALGMTLERWPTHER